MAIQLTQDQLSQLTPNAFDDQGNVTEYYGTTVINGVPVVASVDASGQLNKATTVPASMTQASNITHFDANGNVTGQSVYAPQKESSFLQGVSPILGVVAAGMGIPGLIGSALAPGASAAVQAAIGGAAIGGGTAALGGGNALQGALTGGALGYLGASAGNQPITTNGWDMASAANYDAGLQGVGSNVGVDTSGLGGTFAPDYSLSSGMTNLSSMGGGQGLNANLTGNLDYMGGGQGLNTSGLSSLADMGGGQGLTYVNPSTGQVSNAAGGVTDYTGLGNVTTPGTLGSTVSNVNTGITPAAAAVGAPTYPTGSDPLTSGGGVLGTGLTAGQLATLGGAVASGVGGGVISNAISNAAATQQAAGQQAGQTLKDIYNQQLGFVQPYQAAGQQGLNQISANMPYLTHQFNAADLAAGLAPNYNFMLQQGQMANQRAANVGGGALSGNTLQGLQKFTQDYAGNAYQNAFNNYQQQRSNIFNTLSNIAGLGQTANAQALNAGTGYGQQQTGLTTGLAAAQAAAQVGQGQNTANTLGNIMNNITLASLLNQKPSVVPPQ